MPNLPPPLVTICIPLHNYEMFIVDCIRSVQAQTLNNIEVFIVNDDSTDDSEKVAREAIKDDSRFQIINVNNHNLSATRNDGIKRGTAPYICCLDSDDMMGRDDFLEILVTALEQSPDIGIAYTGITIMDVQGKLGHLNAWPKEYDVEKQVARQNQIPSLCVFRRVAWERAGGYRPMFHHAEDAEFWLTCVGLGFKAKQITKEGLFHYRLHNKSASQVHRTGEIKEPDWTEFHPWTKDGQRPFAADGKAPNGSWPVRFYHQPQVSVIIPVGKGHEEAVKDALHSVEGQTHRLWECIVVLDDVQSDLSGFPWAKVISSTKHLGSGAARNLGASKANSTALVFLDADDILKPSFLADSLKAYKAHGRYIYSDWLTDDRKGNVEIHKTLNYSYAALRETPSLHLVTALIPRKWFEAVGGFDEKLTAFEDVDLFMKLYTHGYCGARIPQPLVMYNLDAGYRRKSGDSQKEKFKTLMLKRYGKYMESDRMCDCVEPPKGLPKVPPSPENLASYHATYGDMVLIEYVSQFAPESPTTFRGPATHVNYGYRAKGDIFNVWEADVLNSDGVFIRVGVFESEPDETVIPDSPESTIVPPPPDPVQTETPFEQRLEEYNSVIDNGDGIRDMVKRPSRTVANQPKRGGKSTATKKAVAKRKTS